ncbi:MAG: hypothetical protein MUF54_20550 [Polyangiaceae bacterium]|nr:hypothetical protein [Polyangiaceae bacterium]
MMTLDAIRPSQTTGKYEFLVPIARGGMAWVWAAQLKGTRGFAKTVATRLLKRAQSRTWPGGELP